MIEGGESIKFWPKWDTDGQYLLLVESKNFMVLCPHKEERRNTVTKGQSRSDPTYLYSNKPLETSYFLARPLCGKEGTLLPRNLH